MGCDKAMLRLHGLTLLERALEVAQTVASQVAIVGPKARYGPDAIEDIFPSRGPLGGIHAALSASATDLNLVLSVDTPFVTPEFLSYLVAQAEASTAKVTVPFLESRFQPLCAVYRRDFLALAERALNAGENKIDALFSRTTVRRIEDAEWKRLAFDARMFDNLNTPEDYARAQKRK